MIKHPDLIRSMLHQARLAKASADGRVIVARMEWEKAVANQSAACDQLGIAFDLLEKALKDEAAASKNGSANVTPAPQQIQALESWLADLRNEGSPHADDLDHALMQLAQANDRIKDVAAKCGGAV